MRAPDFPSHLRWLNTNRKYSLKDFKRKIVLLDFWTYCCINCMHVIPDLKKLEEKYPELVVIGVHSAKFHNEKIKENINQAILRYDIEHPVVIDNDFILWRIYGINAWPSFILIDPEGKIVGKISGEGIFMKIDPVIDELSKDFEEKGLLNKERMKFELLKITAPHSLLYFPGKIATDPQSKLIFISDSNHNRIIIAKPNGEVIKIIGSGKGGNTDGNFEKKKATFFRPQGITFYAKKDILYVADTDNHLIREVDLKSQQVKTILGTGEQGSYSIKEGNGTGLPLNSPWDITILGDYLYIAMAGSHQIWRMHLKTYYAQAYAGSGREDIIDGALDRAALAQPSGITTDGKNLYFADSEVSAIRMIENNKVKTIIGVGLFDFGDVDGHYPKARLQHPIGIHYYDGQLYIADTYNHKIKIVNPKKKTAISFIGTGKPGYRDATAKKAQLNEPNDIAFLDGKFYIADTNNHLIRVYDPSSKEVSTFSFKDMNKLTSVAIEKDTPFQGKQIKLPEKIISRKTKGLRFQLKLPKKFKWTPNAPCSLSILSDNESIISFSQSRISNNFYNTLIPFKNINIGKTTIKIQAAVYYCNMDAESKCYFEAIEFILPTTVKDMGKDQLEIYYDIIQ